MLPASTSLGQKQVTKDTRAEFSHLHKFWHAGHKKVGVRVNAGEYYVGDGDEVITSVLGSCIAVCAFDPDKNLGGMNHFLLPQDGAATREVLDADPASFGTRFGATAMERLFNALFKLGGRRERMQVKIFGGGNVLPTITEIGAQNANFARTYLKREGFSLVAEDVEGPWSREVKFFPTSGEAFVRRVAADTEVQRQEARYLEQVSRTEIEEDVELF